MCVKFPLGYLNLGFYPLHSTSTYTCEVTTAPMVRSGESLIFKSKGNGDLYWTNVEMSNHITQFIESDFCNFALKLVLCRKLKSFFNFYISHDFLDPSISIQTI